MNTKTTKTTKTAPAAKAIPTPAAKKAKAKATVQKELAIAATTADRLALIPLDMIDTAPQVRTEFDDDTIAELAKDIAANGILQPLTVQEKGERYELAIGERRLRAARLAKLDHVPAIVKTIDPKTRRRLQLAENIQREELTLNDLAKAVREMFDDLGSLQAVADACNKSKPWASKHLSLTMPDLPWCARQLLETGACEDIETIKTVEQIYKLAPSRAWALCADIQNGKAGRQTARDLLAELKDDIEKAKTAKPETATAKEAKPAGSGTDNTDDDDTGQPPTPNAAPEFGTHQWRQAIRLHIGASNLEAAYGMLDAIQEPHRTAYTNAMADTFNTFKALREKGHQTYTLLYVAIDQHGSEIELAAALDAIAGGTAYDMKDSIKRIAGFTNAYNDYDQIIDGTANEQPADEE